VGEAGRPVHDENEPGPVDMVHSAACVPGVEVGIPPLRKLMSFASANERLFNVDVRDSSDRAAWVDEAEGMRAKRGRRRGRPKLGCAEAKYDAGGVDRPAMRRLQQGDKKPTSRDR
jgi:hypothetical protein